MSLEITIEETFPRAWQFEEISEIARKPKRRFFLPPTGVSANNNSTAMRLAIITPDAGEPWLALMDDSDSIIYSCPDPNTFLYAGYLVDVLDPAAKVELATYPVQQIFPIPSHCLIAFATFDHVFAIGMSDLRSGEDRHVRWTTERPAWDDVKLTHVLDEYLYGTGRSPISAAHKRFRIDLRDGKHTGGAYPDAIFGDGIPLGTD